MVSVDDKSSNEVKGDLSEGMTLDRARRAALAEVDNAPFSYVALLFFSAATRLD
jgi:hypothetical protein